MVVVTMIKNSNSHFDGLRWWQLELLVAFWLKRRLSSNGNSNFTNYANTNIVINNTKNIHVEVSTATERKQQRLYRQQWQQASNRKRESRCQPWSRRCARRRCWARRGPPMKRGGCPTKQTAQKTTTVAGEKETEKKNREGKEQKVNAKWIDQEILEEC